MYLILSILIAMGEQFPKPESEIRFGWGMSYNYIEQLHHNLNKYDLENKVVTLEDGMVSLAHVAIEGLQHLQCELIRKGRHIWAMMS